MIKPNTSIYYHYNEYNEVCGISYNGKEYFIDRDIVTKNIDKILDKQGKIMVQYKYTAYGIPTISIGTNLNSTETEEATILMNENIFLYKGYVYDNETGLYYCNSRYYNPEWGRWISPDSIDYLDPESINGLNLYAYCRNDPVNNYDPSGHIVISALLSMVLSGTAIGALTGLTFSLGKQLIKNDWDFSEIDIGSVVNSTIVGAALGFSLAMGVGYLGPAIAGTAAATGLSASGAFAISSAVSFGAGALGYAFQEWINGKTPDFGKTMMHGGFVMLEGMVNFGVGGIIGSVGTIGTKGKPIMKSIEWYAKFAFGQEFTQPFKICIDLLRYNI